MTVSVTLKPGRDKPVRNRHPWVYAGAIKGMSGNPEDGDILAVRDAAGQFLAWGYLNRRSQIALRLLSWDPDERIEVDFWRARLTRAWKSRQESILQKGGDDTTAYRLVNAESDGLPGLVVDQYAGWLVVQFLTLGMEIRKEELLSLLVELAPDAVGVYERSDVDVREKEGLPSVTGPMIRPAAEKRSSRNPMSPLSAPVMTGAAP